MLNLPSGTYALEIDSRVVQLEILQEQIAIHFSDRQFAVGDPGYLQTQLGENYTKFYRQPLRTVLRKTDMAEIAESDLPTFGDEELLEDMQGKIIGEDSLAFAGDKDGLKAEARRRISTLTPQEIEEMRLLGRVRRYGRRVLTDKEQFLDSVNALVRLYMQHFNDFFVEEVAVHQLASQSPLTGIYVQIDLDGRLVDKYGIVERFAPIMRRPWLKHPPEKVQRFKEMLSTGVLPDSVSLLGVRARAFLQRGAFRSAIIEASAGLDLAISKKIREGYRKQDWSAGDIDGCLRKIVRFEERGKRLLRESVGKSASDLDNSLWSNVKKHRDKFRQGVAHADSEPPRNEAEAAVEDMLRLASLVRQIVPKSDIRQRAYFLWLEKGRRDGCDIEDWLEAESALTDELTASLGT